MNGCNSNDPGAPCFAHVTDILGGTRYLLRDDDLVVNVPNGFQEYSLFTQGLKVNNQTSSTIINAPCGGGPPNPAPFQTRVGRLFNLKNDVIVNLAPLSAVGAGCSGMQNLGFYIEDPQNPSNNSSSSLTASPISVQVVLNDFNDDGFDDVFLVNDQAVATFTAVSTISPAQGVKQVSVSGSVNIEGFGLMASAGFDYNQSQSVSTLNTAASTYADSTGVTVNRGVPGGPISSSNYLYQGQSFIFGQTAPTGTIQSDLSTNTTVQAQGFLSVGFASDPLSTGTIQSGDWWKQAYTAAPDVALNHPQRWLQKEPTGTNPQQVWFNCPVGFTSSPASPACASVQQAPTPANVADALFYQMKGLFVTPGTTPGGPQITMTTQGQTVTLRARVCNYSLANMPAGATVHVQFYAQPWDATTGQFLGQTGNPDAFAPAVLIGEDQLEPIPAFCGGSQGDIDPCADESPPQNWVFAETSWDTGRVSADTYWKFWVVAWMEQGGQLVQEIGDHGLKSIPASPLNSLADVPVETYSNNLGFYNQTFSVVSAVSAAGSQDKAQAPATGQASLVIDDIKAPPGSLRLHQPIMVRASHRSDAGPGFDSILSLFYDGDPEKGGVLFDQEIIPGIRAGESFVAPASFQPGTCGKHRLYVQSIPGDGSAAPVTKAATVRVTADLQAELDSLGRAIKAAKLKRGKELRLLAQVKAVRKLLERGRDEAARYLMMELKREIRALSGKTIPPETAAQWIEEAALIVGCIKH